jgi:hypothetical protein
MAGVGSSVGTAGGIAGQYGAAKPQTLVGRYQVQLERLRTIFSSWKTHYKTIAQYLYPRKVRFDTSEHNYGGKRNQKIINNTARTAHRTMASGMHAGITSPARPWFRLIFDDPELMKRRDVKVWLAELSDRMYTVLARSNCYKALPECYEDIGAWGITNMMVLPDEQDVIRCEMQPIGSYFVALDKNKRVRRLFRERIFTVDQMVKEFGHAQCSRTVQNLYDTNQLEEQFAVINVIEENDEREHARQMRGWVYRSVWYERDIHELDKGSLKGNATNVEHKYLRISGYRTWPAMIPRWSATGDNAYGDSPAMDALPDIQMLQQMERRKLETFDKILRGPVNAPASITAKGAVALLPGGVNPTKNPNERVTPVYDIDPKIAQMDVELARVEHRIGSCFFADLFLMLARSPMQQNITAREIEERHEEKMLQLGPVLERLHDELLDPFIERVYDIMDAAGLVPPAPPDIEGMPFRVEYTSILAESQKLLGTVAIERLVEFVIRVSEAKPEILDNIDFDEVARRFAAMLGVPPEVITAQQIVDEMRAQREQQNAEMQAQQAGAIRDVAAGAKDLGQTQLGNASALDQLASAMGNQTLGVDQEMPAA